MPLPGEPGGDEHAQEGFKAVPVAEGKKKGKKQAKAVARVVVPQVVDTVVCCLSLMGVNWVGGIYEAARILKTGYVNPFVLAVTVLMLAIAASSMSPR